MMYNAHTKGSSGSIWSSGLIGTTQHASLVSLSSSVASLLWHHEIARMCLLGLALIAFLAVYGLSLGFMLALHRIKPWGSVRGILAQIAFASAIPMGMAINALIVYVRVQTPSDETDAAGSDSSSSNNGSGGSIVFVSSSLLGVGSVGLCHSSLYARILLLCECVACGLLIHSALVDVILEEWARRDANWAKTVSFGTTAALVMIAAFFTV